MPKIWLYLPIRPDCRNRTLFLFSLPMDGCAVPSQINAFNNYLKQYFITSHIQRKAHKIDTSLLNYTSEIHFPHEHAVPPIPAKMYYHYALNN